MQTLRPYQREAGQFLARNQRAILAYPPGTGKTAIVSAWLESVEDTEHRPYRFLVVAPNGPVLQHWQAELFEWGTISSLIGTGDKGKRSKHRAAVTDEKYESLSLVLNYECMRQDIDELLKIEWDAVVFDESHRLKNRKSLTFKAAGKLARRTPRLALVTGTPLLNSADELWTSLHMLEPTKYRSFWRWAEYHFHVVTARHRGRPVTEICTDEKCSTCGGRGMLPGHAELIRAELKKSLIQKPIELLLPDLPAVTETYLSVSLDPAERRMHDSMESKFWMEHGGELVIAPNKISQSLRLRQLASDWSAFGGDGLGSKGKAALGLIEALDGEPVVVFCSFRATVTALVQALNPEHKAIQYHGGMDANARQGALQQFTSGQRKVLVGTISTMGEGIDGMQHVARNVIFLDRDWTPARNEQAVGRLRRSGQQSNVNVIHLVAKDSMDDVIAKALRRKESVVDAVMGRLSHPKCIMGQTPIRG